MVGRMKIRGVKTLRIFLFFKIFCCVSVETRNTRHLTPGSTSRWKVPPAATNFDFQKVRIINS